MRNCLFVSRIQGTPIQLYSGRNSMAFIEAEEDSPRHLFSEDPIVVETDYEEGFVFIIRILVCDFPRCICIFFLQVRRVRESATGKNVP